MSLQVSKPIVAQNCQMQLIGKLSKLLYEIIMSRQHPKIALLQLIGYSCDRSFLSSTTTGPV